VALAGVLAGRQVDCCCYAYHVLEMMKVKSRLEEQEVDEMVMLKWNMKK
jgi:hypothetical protein